MSAFKIKASSGGGDFSVPPPGNHPAVLVGLVDVGTQEEEYQGVRKSARKVFLAWELTGEADPATGKNFIVGRDYTASMHERSALRAIIEKWRGKALGDDEEFELTKILGKPCLLSLVHKQSQTGKTYAKIDSIGALPKGMTAPPATITPFSWEIEGGDVSKIPDWMPRVYGELIKDVIARAEEITSPGETKAASATTVDNDELAAIF